MNVSSFDSLGSLMSSLGGDDLELEEYFSLLFNNSEAVSLLTNSVRADSDAQQAVIDALETNTEVRREIGRQGLISVIEGDLSADRLSGDGLHRGEKEVGQVGLHQDWVGSHQQRGQDLGPAVCQQCPPAEEDSPRGRTVPGVPRAGNSSAERG